MTSYSDEEVKEAIAYTKGSETLPVIAELVWAASQYLTLKQEKQVLWPAMQTIEIK